MLVVAVVALMRAARYPPGAPGIPEVVEDLPGPGQGLVKRDSRRHKTVGDDREAAIAPLYLPKGTTLDEVVMPTSASC